MQRSFVLPIAIAGPLAAGVYALAYTQGIGPEFESRDVLGLAAFIFVALVAEGMAVDFRLGSGKQQPHASMAFLPFIGILAVFSPQVAVPTVAGVLAFSQVFARRNGLARATYNVLQGAATVGIAGLAYHSVSHLMTPIPFFVGAVVFFAANIALAGVTIAYLKGTSLPSVVTHIASGLKYDALASPIAFFPVALYDTLEPIVIVILLPLLLFHRFHISKQQLLDTHTDVIRVLIKAIETRDPYTSGHSIRVSTMAQLIAVDMGLSRANVRLVYKAALLHDIGKIDPVFQEVLQKPYSLTPEERALIETHAEKGATTLRALKSVEPEVVQAVLHHHERYDGKGYPHGISGDQIPVAARIIMLCDSVDAMLSDRPYRKALTVEAVHDELERCSGTQFDPDIVRTVLSNGTLERAVALLSVDLLERSTNFEFSTSGVADQPY